MHVDQEDREAARERVTSEPVKKGTRAIVNDQGQVVGTKPEEAARERVMGDPSTEYPDGTKVEAGKLVKMGPRAIVNEQGQVIGMKPETQG